MSKRRLKLQGFSLKQFLRLQIFIGPSDTVSKRKQKLSHPIRAFGIKINPISKHNRNCLRMELYGYGMSLVLNVLAVWGDKSSHVCNWSIEINYWQWETWKLDLFSLKRIYQTCLCCSLCLWSPLFYCRFFAFWFVFQVVEFFIEERGPRFISFHFQIFI